MQTAHEPGRCPKSIVDIDTLTDDEINALPEDDFADAVIAKLETKDALLSMEDFENIDAALENMRAHRRAALLLLTKPWPWLREKVIEDRDFALAVAFAWNRADDCAAFCANLADMLQTAQVWAMVALACRADCEAILKEACQA